MTDKQRVAFLDLIKSFHTADPIIFHHGDCIGADADAHDIVLSICGTEIHIHPPTESKYRACCIGAHLEYRAAPYLQRNHNIVDSTSLMIATPEGAETLRSGTWATIRYALKKKKEVYIIDIQGDIYSKTISA